MACHIHVCVRVLGVACTLLETTSMHVYIHSHDFPNLTSERSYTRPLTPIASDGSTCTVLIVHVS